MWLVVASSVVAVHVLVCLAICAFWPQVRTAPLSQYIFGAVRCRLQPLLSRIADPWDAHHIADGVYLGNLASGCNLQRMRQLRVSRVVSVMIGAAPVFPAHFNYTIVHVRDLPEENLLRHLDETTRVISEAVQKGEVVYVHCAAGVSRSATVVCAWLMRSRGLSHEAAIVFLRERRAVIRPNPGFVAQLRVFEERLVESPRREAAIEA
jgi:atypical dual specificity phosphatase